MFRVVFCIILLVVSGSKYPGTTQTPYQKSTQKLDEYRSQKLAVYVTYADDGNYYPFPPSVGGGGPV